MRTLTSIFLIILSQISAGQSSAGFFEDANTFLLEHVTAGKVDYKILIMNTADLDDLTSQISSYDLSGKDKNYRLAFYINAYNLLVIKQVTNHYPIKSPLSVSGFFDKYWHTVAGERMTLDQLEFDKIFMDNDDPRIHFALGCAGKSCPFLNDNAFTPEHIQEELDFRSQLIIDQAIYVTVDDKLKKVTVSKVFDWYKDLFIKQSGSIIKFINTYRHYKVPEDYTIEFYKYDWTLNEQ